MHRKLRVLLQHQSKALKFWWFEMKGDDFYWEPSSPSRLLDSISPDSEQMTVTVPDDKDAFENLWSKASFHESGQFHLKHSALDNSSTVTDKLKNRMVKSDITAPVRFMALISKSVRYYPEYRGSLTRNRTSAAILEVPDDAENPRLYLEFFLSPEGTFASPTPLLKFRNCGSVTLITHSISNDLILLICVYELSPESDLSSWQPDVEIAVYGLDKGN